MVYLFSHVAKLSSHMVYWFGHVADELSHAV